MAQADYVNNAIRALITGGGPNPSTNPIRAAHAELVAALAGHPPRPIPVDAKVIDLEDRADHLNKVLNGAYLTAILDAAAQNVPGGLDLRQVDAVLSDPTSGAAGTIQHAASGMAQGGWYDSAE